MINKLLGKFLLKLQESSRIVARKAYRDVHFWRGVGADVDSVGLASAKRQRGEPPPRTRSALKKQARMPLPFLFAMSIYNHQSLRLLIHD